MLTDAHCHPADLIRVFPEAEQERRRLKVMAAASACDLAGSLTEFSFNEELSRNAAAAREAPLFNCFALHPQLPAAKKADGESYTETELFGILQTLNDLAAAGKIEAVGECGFDLYNAAFKETEILQEKIFAAHIEIALRYELPLILHVRRAMHKIFAVVNDLKKCKAVVFHSWPGAPEEGSSLLRRGVNAYFSFGNTILLNHKQAQKSCALLPAERLLTETDAPYQPQRGQSFSKWSDLPLILEEAAALRNISAQELETQIEDNFKEIFR